jgi:hypothetical protein
MRSGGVDSRRAPVHKSDLGCFSQEPPMTRSDLDDRDGDRQWSQSEKVQILNDARATLARRNDQEIPRRESNQKTRSADEIAEIFRTARANIAGRDATAGMVKKVTYTAPAARQADTASEARQPRQRRQWRRRAEAADDVFFDPIESTGWPEPAKESKRDTDLHFQ